MVDVGAGRRQVAERGLTPAAVGALIPLMGDVGFEELGLVKALLRRFFSSGPWTAMDAAALAEAVGPPPAEVGGVVRCRLDDELELVAGWVDGRFLVDVEVDDHGVAGGSAPPPPADLGRTFDSGVVPQPTPNPRTIRFATASRGGAASAGFRRGEAAGDERVAAVFAVDDDVADVLVAADFVAVSVDRPGRWPELLAPMLEAVAAGFGSDAPAAPDDGVPAGPDVRGVAAPRPSATGEDARPPRRTRLDRAWADLGHLDASRPADLELLRSAARDPDGARRQVAAQLLDRGPPDVATEVWEAQLDDPSRSVRRAVVDVVAGAGREAVRPLLERLTEDGDAWVRWKALHGLVDLGIEPSLHVLDALTRDADFRVRLEAENARRG